eukprot:CAMPEP_0197679432 /NCGR_PEP_ID=MMETSP1338-20131121/91681_1 /TAXON_ID=43686 ORGANISM="Pelagodinium beii, Strain RCC1491" /NCGR_SAMPLE_ID=MMETSP1338 /ASSEMBLY_ACC=CAM_ASM_000754 /LENGTH=35 /DNA_ID= /DNA_START= /DNA_END= /DNA_ORIENTATION=
MGHEFGLAWADASFAVIGQAAASSKAPGQRSAEGL